MRNSLTTIKLTDAQLTAIETAGIFSCPDNEDEVELSNAIIGRTLVTDDPERMARTVCNLSNHADELAEIEFRSDERAVMYRKDSRVLSNLMIKIRKHI